MKVAWEIVGTVAKTPTLRHSKAGRAWTELVLDHDVPDVASPVRVSLFGDPAEDACRRVVEGSRVIVTGDHPWSLVADGVELLDP